MNSLGLILLLSTLSALSAAFAQVCPLEYTAILPKNSKFNKACVSDNYSESPCFHHVSGSLRLARVTLHSVWSDIDADEATPIVKDGFLTDFTFFNLEIDYHINYTEEGVWLRYQYHNMQHCFDLAWGAGSHSAWNWKLIGAVANGGERLFDTSQTSTGVVTVCNNRFIDLWLEKR
ncbi:related to Mig1 - Mig1 protein, induced during biotrophic phase [Ustilago sp. UG-2017b]|nr:related to Mig1 - Mig1 protein, induced during biotrophic phase [Ustilago sp. UG-2017b]